MGFQLMRVRMLNPSSEDFDIVRDSVVPLRIDINDDGLPSHPIFRWHATALDNNPWIRRRFGHFALIDPVNEEVYGLLFGPRVGSHLRRMIAEYESRTRRPPLPMSAEIPDHLKHTFLDPNFTTSYELAFDNWLDVVDTLRDESKLAPGVRNLSVQALGNLLNVPVDAEYLEKCRATSATVTVYAGRTAKTVTEAQNSRLPKRALLLHDRAAIALVMILDLPFDVRDPELVAKTRAWWTDHACDDTLKIEFSDDPRLRYSFLR